LFKRSQQGYPLRAFYKLLCIFADVNGALWALFE
jgi:hypothetical protein